MSQQQIQTVVVVAIVVVLLGFRIYRQTREQRWSLSGMWMAPIIFAILTVIVVVTDTLGGSSLAPIAAAVGLGIGFGIGLYQGNHTTLRVDKPGKAVFIKVTPIGAAIFIAIIAIRFALRYAVGGAPGQAPVGANGMPIVTPIEAILGSGLLALALGSIVGLRWYVKQAYDAAPTAATPTITTTPS